MLARSFTRLAAQPMSLASQIALSGDAGLAHTLVTGASRDQVVHFKEGHTYEGDWQQGVMHGSGTMVFTDGVKYEGQFEHNSITGTGVRSRPSNPDCVECVSRPNIYVRCCRADAHDIALRASCVTLQYLEYARACNACLTRGSCVGAARSMPTPALAPMRLRRRTAGRV
jgi:hypothetical protein